MMILDEQSSKELQESTLWSSMMEGFMKKIQNSHHNSPKKSAQINRVSSFLCFVEKGIKKDLIQRPSADGGRNISYPPH